MTISCSMETGQSLHLPWLFNSPHRPSLEPNSWIFLSTFPSSSIIPSIIRIPPVLSPSWLNNIHFNIPIFPIGSSNEDLYFLRGVGEEENVNRQVVYGRGMALEASHQADSIRRFQPQVRAPCGTLRIFPCWILHPDISQRDSTAKSFKEMASHQAIAAMP